MKASAGQKNLAEATDLLFNKQKKFSDVQFKHCLEAKALQ